MRYEEGCVAIDSLRVVNFDNGQFTNITKPHHDDNRYDKCEQFLNIDQTSTHELWNRQKEGETAANHAAK